MGRYLFLGLAIWAAILIIRHLLRQNRLQKERPRTAKSVDSVQCAYCGLHLPRNEAVHHGDDFFCTSEHKKLSMKGR
ncbi:MAG: PP0621 family protein [Pseudomonadota bacterium]